MNTQSVLACGSALSLSDCGAGSATGGNSPYERSSPCESARGLAQSKTWRSFVTSLVFLAAVVIAHAQSYSIDWFKIAGGGGPSTSSVYSLSGTIGQPDAGGPMTNGPYSLVGGFWVLPIAVQTPGAPTLHITNAAPGIATIWWAPSAPGFTLQLTDRLSPTNWVNAPSGTNNPASVSATLPARFYRLLKQ
jgi:hypothetical protein